MRNLSRWFDRLPDLHVGGDDHWTNTHNDCDRSRLQPERRRVPCNAACGAAGGRAHVFENAADADCVRVPRTFEAVTCVWTWHVVRCVGRGLLHVVCQDVPPTCDMFAPRCIGLRGARCIVHDRGLRCIAVGAFLLVTRLAGPLHALHRRLPFRRIRCSLRKHARTRSRTEQEQSMVRFWALPVVAESQAARTTKGRLRCDLLTLAGGGRMVCVAR
jgi:hypothetical protein